MKMHHMILGSLVAAVFSVSAASGAVIQLTGGDPSDGFNATGLVPVIAVDYNNNNTGTTTWQGIAFQGTGGGAITDHSTTMTWGHNAGTFTGINDTGSAEDNNLKTLLNFGYFASSTTTPTTITFSNLAAGMYQVNLFLFRGNNLNETRLTSVDIVGDGNPADLLTAGSEAWNVERTVTLASPGSIVVEIFGDNYNPVVSAALLSTVIPEPSSLALLGLASVAGLRRRRR